jgi:hypothetical protein
MKQQIWSLLILGAILIGLATAITTGLRREAEHKLETAENIVTAKNKQILGLRDALADYERTKLDPAPVAVRIVK